MSSTRVAINRVVITGRAVTEPITKNVKSHHGDCAPHFGPSSTSSAPAQIVNFVYDSLAARIT